MTENGGRVGFNPGKQESEFVESKRDIYNAHRGRYVDVISGPNRFSGVYIGTTIDGSIILNPFLCPNSNIIETPKGEVSRKTSYSVENRPAIISLESVNAVVPLSEAGVRQKVNGIEVRLLHVPIEPDRR